MHESTKHYNIKSAFFSEFLDPYMKYGPAFFENDGQGVEDAIVAMLDRELDLGNVGPKSKVLDIGCGWGSLAKRLKERFPESEYLGINPSQEQIDFIHSKIDPHLEILNSTFENVDLNQQFDCIFLLGSFCHLKDKSNQLERMRKKLTPEGRIVIEDTFFLSEDLYEKHKSKSATKFVQRDIFGFASIPSIGNFANLIRKSELKLIDMLECTDDYRKTIDYWIARLGKSKSESSTAKDFVRYLEIAQKGWDFTIGNYVFAINALPTN